MARRGQPIGVIVVQASRSPAYTAAEIQALFAVASQMVGIIENARLIEAVERGAGVAGPPLPVREQHGVHDGERELRGVAVSPGIAVGAAVFRGAVPRRYASAASPGGHDVAAERARIRDAFEKTRNDVAHIQDAAARDLGEEHAFIFASHLVMLADPVLHERIDLAVASGQSAPEAIDAALVEIADRLRGAHDPYLQERVEDIDDLRSRLLGHMLPREPLSSSRAQVVLSPRIAPSLVMEMKAQAARAIVAQNGGPTSHGALLARSLGIPAVAGVEDLLDSTDAGDIVVVDGTEGVVVVRPTKETLARYEEEAQRQERRRTEFARYRSRPGATADGVHISILANVAFGADIALAKENGAGGIGLYRTEFPFIAARRLPDAGRTGADLPEGVRRVPGCPGHAPDPRSRGRQVRLEPRRGRRAGRIPRVPLASASSSTTRTCCAIKCRHSRSQRADVRCASSCRWSRRSRSCSASRR